MHTLAPQKGHKLQRRMTVYVEQAATTIAAMGLWVHLLLLLVLWLLSLCFANLDPFFFVFLPLCAIVLHGSDNLTTLIRIYERRIAILCWRIIFGLKIFRNLRISEIVVARRSDLIRSMLCL